MAANDGRRSAGRGVRSAAALDRAQPVVDFAQLTADRFQLFLQGLPVHQEPSLRLPPWHHNNSGPGTSDRLGKAGRDQHLDGLSDGGPAGLVRLGELSFRRQPVPRFPLARPDALLQHASELLGLDRWLRHLVLDGPLMVRLWYQHGHLVVQQDKRNPHPLNSPCPPSRQDVPMTSNDLPAVSDSRLTGYPEQECFALVETGASDAGGAGPARPAGGLR